MNIAKTMEIVESTRSLTIVRLGTHYAYLIGDGSDGSITIEYVIGNDEFSQEWECSVEGIKESLWEWLCTLSRFTRSDKSRTLGSLTKVEAA